MPEPFTPNKPSSSTKEAPYQIDNIQILGTAAGTQFIRWVKGEINAVGECSNGVS
jgi:hypothetical protein